MPTTNATADHSEAPSHQNPESGIPLSFGTDDSSTQKQGQTDISKESRRSKKPHHDRPDQEKPQGPGHHVQDEERIAQNLGHPENSPQDNSTSPDHRDNATNEDDAMSNASSESDLFVRQDDGIKIEDESNPGCTDSVQRQPEQPNNGDHCQEHAEPEDKPVKDNDDECMVIDAEDVPDDIKTKFASFKYGEQQPKGDEVICTGSVRIKTEQVDDRRMPVLNADDENDPDFRIDKDDALSDGERPQKRRQHAPKRQGKRNEASAPEAPEHIGPDSNFGKGGNGEWEEPTEDELLRLYTQQRKLNAIKATRALTLPQRVMLAKVSAKVTEVEQMAFLQASDLGDPMDLFGDAAEEAAAAPAPAESAGPNQDQSIGNTEDRKRRAPPKTAKEFWEREYAEKGSGVRNMTDDVNNKRKRPLKKPNKKKANKGGTRESQLMNMLRDANPIMARAAQGAMEMPGAIQTTRRSDQMKAMKDFLFKISSNPNPRSKPVDMKILDHAIKSFGFRQVRTDNNNWKLRGMTSSLYNHQLVGVSRMLCQEFSPDGPHGGILGDQMGLGKTVQMLATMAANRPTPEQVRAGCHQTLIIAPAVAISQWVREIAKHCDKSFIKSVHHYRASAKVTPEVWQTADIVLASYNEVTSAYPSEMALKRIAGRKLDDEEWAEEFEAELGELFNTRFFRVVLDEGHAIRNHNTKTAKACINLTSKYRWILSGTPIHNSIEEFYPYFRFLGAHWANDADEFARQFGNIAKDDVRERLDLVITSIMIRRHVDDVFLGAPILQIPQTHPPKIIWVDLTTEERLIYRRLESRFRDNISTHMKAGVAQKKLKTYLAYLTRLRQAVAHPYLLEDVLKENFTLEDLAYLRRQLAAVGGKTPMHRQVQDWVTMEYEDRIANGAETTTFGKGRFGYDFDMDTQLEQMEANKSVEEVICRLCYDVPVNPTITDCGHTFCRDCISGSLKAKPTCPTCNTMLWQVESLKQSDIPSAEQNDAENTGRKRRRKKQMTEEDWELGDDALMAQPKMKDSHKWIEEYDKNHPKNDLMASVKTIAVKNQILIWQAEAPNDKIIVFVNWAKLACIIGRVLHEEQIPFLYYFGDLTREQKEAAISGFQTQPNIKVLIASTRCGGQALNLTCANRVMLVDQWWNTALETQAFGRVHRIGQEKQTYFVKIVVKDSIDEGLLEMQQGKEQMISRALQEGPDSEGPGRKTAPTLAELTRLFAAAGDEGGGGEWNEGGDEGEEGEGQVALGGVEGGGNGVGDGGEREVVVVVDDDVDDDHAEGDRIDRVGEAAEARAEEEIKGA